MNYPNQLAAPSASDAVIASGHLLRQARGRRTGRCGLVLALMLLLPLLSAFGGVRYTRVMALGDLAPGTDGQHFHGPGSHKGIPIAAINNRGEVVFLTGFLDEQHEGGGLGIWKWSAGEIRLVARTGQPAPGTTGSFVNLLGVNLNDAGDVAFNAVAQKSPQDPFIEALYVDRGEGPVKVEAPVPLQGGYMGEAFSDAGVACRSADRTRLFLGWPGALREVVRAGDDAPGMANAKFVKLGSPQLNQLGQVAFAASVTAGSQLADGVWVWTDGQLRLAYRYGTRPAGLPAGLNIATGNLAYIDVVAGQPLVRINVQGKVAVWAHIRRADNPNGLVNGNAVLVESGGQMKIVAGYGMDVPGRPGAQFGQLDNFFFNDLGQVAFSALGGTWVGQPGDLRLVAPEVPGLYPLFPVGLGGSGQLFLSSFWDSTCCFNPANPLRQEIWMTDVAEALQQVAKYDSPIPVGISHFHFSEPFQQSGGGDGRARSLNDWGEGVFSALERVEYDTGGFGFTETLVVAQVDPPQQPLGDLLVKRASETDSRYGLDDVYQRSPAGAQTRTNTVGLNSPSEFQVQIQNDSEVATSLRLRARESTDEGWKVEYFLGGTDISKAIRTGAGDDFPELGVDESHVITVRMTATNAPPDSRKTATLHLTNPAKPNRAVDSVECVSELALEIVVNSTGDMPNEDPDGCCCDTGRTLADGEPECTLRAAIEFANRRPGKDLIKFQIPGDDPGIEGGVPSIKPQAALPHITSSVIIDGWSQASGSKTPPIVLTGERIRRPSLPPPGRTEFSEDLMDWAGSVFGLALLADNSEVRGLVIHSFSLCGLGIGGGAKNCVIQGNFIGTDRTGTRPLANGLGADSPEFIRGCGIYISSSGNLIGGAGVHGGNLISGAAGTIWGGLPTATRYAPPGILIATDTAFNNVVQGNLIGTDVSGEHSMAYTTGDQGAGSGALAGVWIASAPGNIVGGEGTDAGNVISGNLVGVRITGGAEGNRVGRNFIGCDANGARPIPNGCGVWVALAGGNVIGGDSMAAANVISGNMLGVMVQGPGAAGNVISWNVIGLNNRPGTAAEAALPNAGGILLWQGSQATTISNNRIEHNRKVGIHIQDSDDNLVATNLISFNGSEDDLAGAGIRVVEGFGNRITANSIFANRGLGIAFSSSGMPTPNDPGDTDQGPNHLQNYPALDSRLNLGPSLPPGGYTIEFFGNSAASPTGYGEGETFLGSVTVTVAEGTPIEIATLPFTPEPGTYVTATATLPDGSTSEFSQATLFQDCEPGIKGLCPNTEARVPNLQSGLRTHAPDAPTERPTSFLEPRPGRGGIRLAQPPPGPRPTGDGNGDGLLDSQQANVASLPGIAGVWMTLAAPNGTVLEHVQSSGPPEFTNRPNGCTFPIGFLSFGITNLTAGGTLAVTNYLHLGAAPGFSYAPTTFFNYGPTPDDAQPHWYEFNFDGTTGAELLPDRIILHLRDGARGDDDLTANGEIVTRGAPAYQIPPGPGLRLTSTVTGMRESIGLDHTTQHARTNVVPVVTSVLSWPASATNWTLRFKDVLASTDSIPTNDVVAVLDFLWQPVPESPVVVNDQYTVTNTAIGQSRFYRLMPSRWDTGLTPEQLVRGTYSWAGNGAWSDPVNWTSTALIGRAPLTNGLQIIDVVFPAGGNPITSVVDGSYAVRSLTIPAGAPGVSLQSGGVTASLTLGTEGLVQQGAGNTTIQPAVVLAVDQTWLIEAGTVTVASLNLGSHSLTVAGQGHLIVQDLAGGAASRVTANGPGQVQFGNAVPASSFRGTLAVAGGSVTSSQAMLTSSSAVELSGSSLSLPFNAILDSACPWQVSGGEIIVNGASGNLGPLQLSGAAALQLGSGTGSLTFASATLANTNGQLTIYDWQGIGGASGTGRQVFVRTPPAAAWLGHVNFVGATFDVGSQRLASGEIVPNAKPPAVLPANALAQFQAYGTGLSKMIVAVSGQAFSQAMRVDTTQKPAQAYNSGVVLRTSAAVAANDNLLARFWIRRVAPATGSAQVQFNFELASGSFEKSVQFPVGLNNDQWQLKSVKFKSKAAYAAGAAEVSFWAGYGVQTVEIGGLEVLNYRGTTPP